MHTNNAPKVLHAAQWMAESCQFSMNCDIIFSVGGGREMVCVSEVLININLVGNIFFAFSDIDDIPNSIQLIVLRLSSFVLNINIFR